MADSAQKLLTVDEFLAITAELDDDMKWELIDGMMTPKASRVEIVDGVVAMAPGRSLHGRTKVLVTIAIERAIQAAGASCTLTTDDVGVRIGERYSYIPDLLVDCGPFDPNARLSVSPTIVVEILSPSTRAKDLTKKLVGYFSRESIMHYLIIDADERDVQHHYRTPTGLAFATHAGGILTLDPPGLTVDLATFFP